MQTENGATRRHKSNLGHDGSKFHQIWAPQLLDLALLSSTSYKMKGKLITETLDYDGGRKASVYVPPSPAKVIIYCGDGQLIPQWGEDLEGTNLEGTIIVGTHRLDDEMDRLKEYTPVFDTSIYNTHEKFFVHQVRDWIKERFGVDLPREKTAMYGVSAGAELALSIGTRHPDVYGAILAASPGAGYRPPSAFGQDQPKTYLVAGKQEEFFLDNAKRWYDALKAGGVETVMYEREGEHGGAFWREELPKMLAWAFTALHDGLPEPPSSHTKA